MPIDEVTIAITAVESKSLKMNSKFNQSFLVFTPFAYQIEIKGGNCHYNGTANHLNQNETTVNIG